MSRSTVAMRIAQVNRALSQVSTYVSICMALLQTALEGCHRPEELSQAAGLLARICTQPLCLPMEAIRM